jgi:hypothetical protein
MESVSKNKPVVCSQGWNRVAYSAFVLLSLYYLIINNDLGDAVATGGIALIFDPFDQQVAWKQRRTWQKVWLLAHLALLFTGLAILLLGKQG